MCCGCYRLMGKDGKPISVCRDKGGFISWSDTAEFPNAKAADQSAEKAGWQVKDKEGPNHRCPDCAAKAKTKGRGAIVTFGDTAALPTADERTTHPNSE